MALVFYLSGKEMSSLVGGMCSICSINGTGITISLYAIYQGLRWDFFSLAPLRKS